MKSHRRRKEVNAKKSALTFDNHFSTIYGKRWPALKASMASPSIKVALWNKFCRLPQDEVVKMSGLTPIEGTKIPVFSHIDSTEGAIGRPAIDFVNTPAYYLLDLASMMIVEQLHVEPYHKVLDLCASPGGKSIAIAQYLSMLGEITSNEANKERCGRLKRNLTEYFPVNSVVLHVTQRDATLWHQPCSYDRVLVDAPCSSERHLLQQGGAGGIGHWVCTNDIASTQLKLLLRALETVKVSGRVVYSTCSINPVENDEVVNQALKKTRCEVRVLPTSLRYGEPTKLGWIVLPDVSSGWGPMYCCTLHKEAELRSQDDDNLVDEENDSDDEVEV